MLRVSEFMVSVVSLSSLVSVMSLSSLVSVISLNFLVSVVSLSSLLSFLSLGSLVCFVSLSSLVSAALMDVLVCHTQEGGRLQNRNNIEPPVFLTGVNFATFSSTSYNKQNSER